jgi:hypothetical protein
MEFWAMVVDRWSTRGLSVAKKIEFWSKQDAKSGCRLWTGGLRPDGFATLNLKGVRRMAHRLAWVDRHGAVPTGFDVLHRCDNRHCVNPDHLFLGTDKDRTAIMVRKGRNPILRGQKNGRAKLSASAVLQIRSDKRASKVVAAELGVDPSTIRYVRRRVTWSDLALDPGTDRVRSRKKAG